MKNRKGAAFLVVVILSAFILLLTGLLAILGQAGYKNQAENLSENKALAVAEKGMVAFTNPLTPFTFVPSLPGELIGMDPFINPLAPEIPTGSITPGPKTKNEDPSLDRQSFYWMRVEYQRSFYIDGSPDPSITPILPIPPKLFVNYVTYDIFKVYSIGVVTNGAVTDLGQEDLKTLVMNGEIMYHGKKITVSSARVISSTVVEKENEAGTLTFVPNTTKDLPEIVSSDDWLTARNLEEGELPSLPRPSDWQEIRLFRDPTGLEAFFGTGAMPIPEIHVFKANVGIITVAAGPWGNVTPATTPLTYAGGGVPITALPNAGYHFVDWAETSNTSYINIANAGFAATTIAATSRMLQGGGATVTATFAANVSGIITVAAVVNGTVSPTAITLTYAGDAVTITATPVAGYHFVRWVGTSNAASVSLADANSTATTITATSNMPHGGTATIVASFAANVSVPITIAAGDNGTVMPSTTTLTYMGASRAITAAPVAGYHFVGWAETSNTSYVNIANAGFAATTITATSRMPQGGTATVTASFTANVSGAITVITDGNGIGEPTATTLTYAGGAETIIATPVAGYHFVSWAVTDNPSYIDLARTNTAVTTIAATSNMPHGGTAIITASFATNISSNISIITDGNGAVSPTSTILTYMGSAVTITATPAIGYHFVSWEVTSNAANINLAETDTAATTITATSNMPQGGTATVTATFAGNVSGAVTIAAGTNGTVTPTATTLTYAGTARAITATPNVGYYFVSWTITSNAAYVSLANANLAATTISATTNMPQGGTATVTASFAINTYTITASTGSNGTVTPVGATPKNYGDTQVYVITATTPGYHIASVTVDGSVVATTSPYTFTALAANHTISATFAINTYTITASAGSNGTVTPTGVSTWNFWDSTTYVITPAEGHNIASITVDGTVLTSADFYLSAGIGYYTFLNLSLNHMISATFAINTYTLSYIAGSGGTITGITLQTVNYGANGTTVTAVPNTGYIFINWTDGVATAVRTDNNITANKTVTANFASNTFTLTYIPGINGTIAGTTPQTATKGSDGTAVTAVPNPGYSFLNWGDGVATATRTDTNVTANLTVAANFASNWLHNAAILTGYIGPGGADTIPSVLDGVTITSIGSSALDSIKGHLLTSVIIPNSVVSISIYAFKNCAALTSVTLGSGVTSIGQYAFQYCTSLTSLTIPNNVTSIGICAFMDCTALTSVTMGSGVTSIAIEVFANDVALTSVIIGSGVTSISVEAFFGCSALPSVTIPASVTNLDDLVFYNCSNLTIANFLGNAPTGTNKVFLECKAGFYIHRLAGATGWGTTWYGYTVVTP
jgi:hypothetical protein